MIYQGFILLKTKIPEPVGLTEIFSYKVLVGSQM